VELWRELDEIPATAGRARSELTQACVVPLHDHLADTFVLPLGGAGRLDGALDVTGNDALALVNRRRWCLWADVTRQKEPKLIPVRGANGFTEVLRELFQSRPQLCCSIHFELRALRVHRISVVSQVKTTLMFVGSFLKCRGS
jgi:hypothetical protein